MLAQIIKLIISEAQATNPDDVKEGLKAVMSDLNQIIQRLHTQICHIQEFDLPEKQKKVFIESVLEITGSS